MKKITLILALVLCMGVSMQAKPFDGTKFGDNWSVSLQGGGIAPFQNYAFWKAMRGNVGVDITKMITPNFGLGIEGMWSINTTSSKTIFDASNVSLLGKFNLMNIFAGYNGTPRFFEMELVGGMGWGHTYHLNGNGVTSKVGLNFNFNLGESKAWTIAVKPAIVWGLDAAQRTGFDYDHYNANNAVVELTGAITYHFNTSNGTHHFTNVRAYDQAEVDGLNSKINGLRSDLSNKDSELAAANAKIAQLNSDLDACRAEKSKVTTVTKTGPSMESVVTFAQGKSVVVPSQLPNVERIATYLKNHKNVNVSIKGYASPEGGAEINAKLANARAEAVKNILVKKYKINANRISAQGEGVGNMFSEPDWNRVSICTLDGTDK
jgi:OOP family OmpA-OmpF porin